MRCGTCGGGTLDTTHCGCPPPGGDPQAESPRPAGPPLLYPEARTLAVAGVGRAATILVGLAVLAYLCAALSPVLAREIARRAAANGDRDLLLLALMPGAVTGIFYSAAFLGAIVLVIIWCYRARWNLDAFPDADPGIRPAATIAGWLVPLVNLVVPYRVVANIARDSLQRARTPGLVVLWWAAWLLFLVSESYVSRADSSALDRLPTTPITPADFRAYLDYYDLTVARFLLPLAPCIVAGLALIMLIRRISAAQQSRIDHGRPAGPAFPGAFYPGALVGPVPPDGPVDPAGRVAAPQSGAAGDTIKA